MEKNSFDVSQEMEQMRAQFKILSEKIERQEIISNRHLMSYLKNKINTYDWWDTWVQIAGLIICCPILIIVAEITGMAPWINIVTVIYCITGTALLIIKKKRQDKLLDYNGDIRQFAKGVKTIRKWNRRSYLISLPLVLLYIVLYCINFFSTNPSAKSSIGTDSLIGMIASIAATIILAIFVDNRKRGLLDDMTDEIG